MNGVAQMKERVLLRREIYPGVEIEIVRDAKGSVRAFIRDEAGLGSNVVLLPSYWLAIRDVEKGER